MDTCSYPVELELTYKVSGDSPVLAGAGQTLSMSRDELHFVADRALPKGTELDISVAWPVLLDNRLHLQLCLEATVTSNSDRFVSARFRRYQFRIRNTRPQTAASMLPALVPDTLLAPSYAH
jgi:hypothetical protein